MRLLRLPLIASLAASALVACGSTASSPNDTDEDGGKTTGDTGTVIITPKVDGGASHLDASAIGKDTGTTTGDAGASTNAGQYDALPPFPQVTNSNGGVLATPEIVAIFFNNDDANLASFQQFYMGLGTSSLWKTATEYGVGPATVTIVNLAEAAPTSIDDTPDQSGDNTALETWLLAEIASNAIPAPTTNTAYMINYPSTTKVTASGNACSDFDGYHSDMQNSDNVLIAYGVIPRCTDPGSSEAITFTSTVSHEAIEATTDPYPNYSPAFAQADNDHLDFDEANDGSEVADMCENDPEAYYQFSDFPFTVQRIWSNASAKAGHDPCVPLIPGEVFFNAVPELPDTGQFDYYGQTVTTSSVHIAVGATATVYIDLYADGTIPDFDVDVLDYNEFYGGEASQDLLDISMTKTTGNNGDRLAVTIKVKAAGNENTNGQVNNTEMFAIIASQGTSDTSPAHYWYGLVTN